jgi:hypothetical protein
MPSPDERGYPAAVAEPILTQRALNRAMLARQLLLERVDMAIPDAVAQVGGLQTQYSPSGYVGLWTRLRGFQRGALTLALEDRSVIQATLLRTTIHMVARREYWAYELGVRQARRTWASRLPAALSGGETVMQAKADRVRAELADGPRTVKELGDLGSGFLGNLGIWVDLVRVPPSGTWERRRADRLALAEAWVGPPDTTEEAGLTHLVRAYLRAFGPAPWKDIASWAGLQVADVRRGAEGLDLRRYRDEDGQPLVDLGDAPQPDADAAAPVRFLPHWDAILLVHARRTGVLPEAYRSRILTSKNPFSVGTYLVDGLVAGTWSLRDGRVVLDELSELDAKTRKVVEQEREALEAFHA